MDSNSVMEEAMTRTVNVAGSRTESQSQVRFVTFRKGRFFDLPLAPFVALLLTSNIATIRLIGLELPRVPDAGGSFFSLVFDGGAMIFPFTYILGDVLSEVYGFCEAHRTVLAGFTASVLASIPLHLVTTAPPNPEGVNRQAFQTTFGLIPRVVVASSAGCVVRQLLNALALMKMKGRMGGRFLWGRMIASTPVGGLTDTVLFCTVAFAGVTFGADFWNYVVTGYIYKCGLEIITSPLNIQMIRPVKRDECNYLPAPDAVPIMLGSTEISDS